MYNVTLIGTYHSESGKCNSDELYKIIDRIRPEIIFEELPRNLFELFYNENCNFEELNKALEHKLPINLCDRINSLPLADTPLEINCIKKYLQCYSIGNIPVDVVTDDNISIKMQIIFGEMYKNDDIYQKLVDESKLLLEKFGFDYLNSKNYIDNNEKMILREKQIIESNPFYKYELLNTYQEFYKQIIDEREHAMLNNIYDYSKQQIYYQAVFLIGARHKSTIVKKIMKYNQTSEIKLNWSFYGN